MIFRPLRADEIDCRVSTINVKGLSLLLYKDARCDMRILDEMGVPWQRKHYECKGNLFCSVGIKCDDEWIWKDDCGTESYTEKEKGEASDSFKRACFNWGIGRELYTSPFLWIPAENYNVIDKGGKPTTYDHFKCTFMRVEDGKITALNIENAKTHKTVYTFGDVLDGGACCVCGKRVSPYISENSKKANAGKVYCSGACLKGGAHEPTG